MKGEEIGKILPHQKFPPEESGSLKHIAENFSKNGLAFVLMKAYCIGVIDGKRIERMKRKRM